MRLAFVALLLLAAQPSVSWAQNVGIMKGSDLLALCRSTETDKITACQMAFFTAAVMHDIDANLMKADKNFCPPGNTSAIEMKATVLDQLEKHPERSDQQFMGALITALFLAYPCK